MKVMPAALVMYTFLLNFAQVYQPATALNVNVNCSPPDPGIYSLGWGASRLIIPSNARPYYTFRGQNKPVADRLCKSGDNSGVIAFRSDGTVWAYVKASE